MSNNKPTTTLIPTRNIGPVLISGEGLECCPVMVPMATYETTLWPSVERGARVCHAAGGIISQVTAESMTRSILMQADNATCARKAEQLLQSSFASIAEVISQSSRYARLQKLHIEQVANLLYIRIECSTGEASGHNMTTKAAGLVIDWIGQHLPQLEYVSISANYCTDKKASAINGICGRGKRVIAEINLSRDLCHRMLKTTPEKMVDLNLKKNLLGSILAGSVRSANAHFANMLLATYLATGQDAANIVEGSQGLSHLEVKNNQLYFSVTLPNIIVGTIGHGKHHPSILDNLARMHCLDPKLSDGANSRRLAAIIGATVLCGELSLLAALCNQNELMRAHQLYERKKQTVSTSE